MSDLTPKVLQVIQEDIPNFTSVYLIYMRDEKLPKALTNITLTLRSDLDRVEYDKEFELIYDSELDAHFYKELNNFNKKLICNELILSNKEFFSKIIPVDSYNLLINSQHKTIENLEFENKEVT